VVEFDIKNRYTVLKEVIDEANNKVLVFVPFKHAIDLITAKLLEDGVTAEVIRGDVSAVKRTEIFKKFQESPNPRVLVIQPQAAAHGVTLHAANVVVWWGPITSIETYLQANARVHRAGQHHPCTVVHLQGSAVEKRIYKMLSQKLDVHTRLIELYENFVSEVS
jgi:SNF2 family DNA or RNA helicase